MNADLCQPGFDAQPAKACAWDFIGFPTSDYEDQHVVQVVGGRAKYDTVMYNDDTPGGQVILGRLNDDLSQTLRYVDPDTPMVMVPLR